MAPQASGRAVGLLRWLGVAGWLVAAGWILAGVALESLTADPDGSRRLATYGTAFAWAGSTGAIGFGLLVASALRDGRPDQPGQAPVAQQPPTPSTSNRYATGRRLAAGAVIALGVTLTAVSWLLPWQAWHDESLVIDVEGATGVFAIFGHVLVLAAVVLLAVGLISPTGRRLHWWLASALGWLGLVSYWLATPIFESSQTDTEAWVGPGVPTATIGFLAILGGAALPLLPAPRQLTIPPGSHPPVAQNAPGRLGLMFGIIAVLFGLWCFVLGAPLGVAAVVLGLRGRRLAAAGLAGNRGQARAALTLGGIALGASAVYIVLFFGVPFG